MHLPLAESTPYRVSEHLFAFDNVSLAFGGQPVLKGFSAEIRAGEKWVIRGPSGSGKSSLIRLLLGFAQPDSGTVQLRSEQLTAQRAWALRREIAYVNQSQDFETSSVSDTLTTMCRLKSCCVRASEQDMVEALASFGLPKSILRQQTREISGGERQRIALASALLLQRNIFILDEPTAALDGGLKISVAKLFLEHPEWTVIAIAHDESWFRSSAKIIDLS